MTSLLYVIIAATLLLLTVVIQLFRKPRNYPPGPKWYPITGCLFEFKKRVIKYKGYQHMAFLELHNEYNTDILGLKFGGSKIIDVFGYENVKRILTEKVFEGRPDSFFFRLRSLGTRKGITGTDGEFWREQRSFLVRHLHNVGFGGRVMESKIIDELNEIEHIIDSTGPVIEIKDLFTPSILNILWSLTSGANVSREDPTLKCLYKLMDRRSKQFDMAGGLLSTFPWLRFVMPEKTGYNLVLQINNEMKSFLMKIIREHHETYTDGNTSDLIYAFITEMKKQNGAKTTFTDDQLLMMCVDLFIGGSQTTSATLSYLFLLMIKRPDIQQKCQAEVDRVLNGKTPDLKDVRERLPYCEAVITEIFRLHMIMPTIGPRRALHDTTLEKYNIPKDTTILINLWSVNMDEHYWKDPEEFKPERFLNDAGEYVPNERVMPFGNGKRRCPSEALARSCLNLFFIGLIQKYHLEIMPGTNPTMTPMPAIVFCPPPYSLRFVKRKCF